MRYNDRTMQDLSIHSGEGSDAARALFYQKAYRLTIPLSTIISFVLLLICEHFSYGDGSTWLGNIYRDAFQIFIVMMLTSLSGYSMGALVVLCYFIVETIGGDDGFALHAFILLAASLIANLPIFRKWYKSLWKTAITDSIFILVVSVSRGIVITFLSRLHPREISLYFFDSTAILPCTLTCVCCYLYYNVLPEKIRMLFFTSSYMIKELEDLRQEIARRKGAKISTKINTLIIGQAIILMIAAFGVADALFSGDFGHYMADVSMDTIIFATKLTIIMSIIGIPIILLSLGISNSQISLPLTLMARTVDVTYSGENFKPGAPPIDIHSLNIRSKDEIGILYDSLVRAADFLAAYIENIEHEKQLQNDLAVAKEASKAKSLFLSNMSHEIRTPINAVLGLDEMIIRESAEKHIVGYAVDIQSAGRSLLSLVNDILDFSKIEAGKLEIIPVEYDLSSTINDLLNMIEGKAKSKGLAFNLDIDGTLPHLLIGDDVRIKQCVLNILTNAVKYTASGSITLRMAGQKEDDEHILLSVHVEDTGMGIKEEDIPKLFTAFQRIEEEKNRSIEGTGLGINIVQQLLVLMGSKLEVKSVYGKGSDFFFTVRQKVAAWEEIGNFEETYRKSAAQAAAYHESFRAPDAQVLVVDDTKLNLTVAKGLLKQTQIAVDTAESGLETLELIQKKHYDVIFIDHRMPGMDGIETLHAMQALEASRNKGVPCIALTANAISGAREMYLAEGFTDYLTKPMDSVKLEKMLIHYLPEEKVKLCKKEENGAGEAALPQDLASIQGIDVRSALANCGGEDLLRKALRDFHAAIDTKASDIARYAGEKDFKNYTVLVHALKSSARLIGAAELSALAAELEQCGDREDTEEIERKTPALLSLYQAYRERLAPFAPQDSAAKEPMESTQYQAALKNLAECIQAFDFDTADSIIALIDKYAVPESERERYRAIKEKVAAVDQAEIGRAHV